MSTNTSATSTPDRPIALDGEADLDALISEHDRVLVEFYTDGCALCASIEPVIGNVARAHEDLTVATVNPRDDPPLIDRFQIKSVPTLLLFENGEVVGRLASGFQGGDAIDEFLSGATT
ncbi:thioredoxin family protein [Halobellus ordinarius]|uniref:thioredoxin family protein n=1 Tax=Halobellus ordinarius TaxID=3075120 RepID=UPI0028807A02|nr:thioredoxin family protein [Halobellus sp. ZY16]